MDWTGSFGSGNRAASLVALVLIFRGLTGSTSTREEFGRGACRGRSSSPIVGLKLPSARALPDRGSAALRSTPTRLVQSCRYWRRVRLGEAAGYLGVHG